MTNKTKCKGWGCPRCKALHYDVYADVCPTCGLDFKGDLSMYLEKPNKKVRTVLTFRCKSCRSEEIEFREHRVHN